MTPSSVADGIPTPRRYAAAAAIWCAMATSVLGSSAVSVAIPALAKGLGRAPADAVQVVTFYQLAIMMALLACGRAGERYGFRRIYLCGVAVFAIGSVASAFASGFTALVVARFAQGLGAACTMAVNGALLRLIYPRRLLGRGTGYNSVVTALSAAAGPGVATVVLLFGSWRWLFLINLPLSLAALAIGAAFLPRQHGNGARLDGWSVLLSATVLGGLFMGMSASLETRSTSTILLPLAVAAAAAVPLVRRSRAQTAPLVPLDLLRVPILRLSYLTSACSFAAMMVASIALPFVLIGRHGFTQVEMGLLITPLPVGLALSAPVSGRLVERLPAGALGGVGLAVFAGALVVLALLSADPSPAVIVAAMALAGAGFGMFQAPNNRTMLIEAPADRGGAAGAMIAMARLTGQTVGALVVAALLGMVGTWSVFPLWTAAVLASCGSVFSVHRPRPDGDF